MTLFLASNGEFIWKHFFEIDFVEKKKILEKFDFQRSEIDQLIRSENLKWKDKYKQVLQITKEESIYNRYKTDCRNATPRRNKNKQISFNPFLEYEKEKKFFDLNFKNFVKIIKLQVYDPDWFFFFLYSQYRSNTLKIDDDGHVDETIRKRMSILIMIQFFVLTTFPILFFIFYSMFGIIELTNPSQSISIPFLVLNYFVLHSSLISDFLVDLNSVWPSKFYFYYIFIKSKKKKKTKI